MHFQYYLNCRSLTCQQKIRNVKSVDITNEWVYIYDQSGENIILGRLSLLTDEEIIERAREYVEDRQMSEGDMIYYGIE